MTTCSSARSGRARTAAAQAALDRHDHGAHQQGHHGQLLTYHLTTAKQNGVTKAEMAELLTHLAFYAGWPNAWAAFRQAKEVYADGSADANGGLFGLGEPNTAYAQYFTGESFLNPLTDPTKTVFLANVTFSPPAATTGTSTTRSPAAASCCCARTVWAGIRRRESPHRPCTPATS